MKWQEPEPELLVGKYPKPVGTSTHELYCSECGEINDHNYECTNEVE